ncbi:MAG: putative 2-phosphosulfolactate phosphatase [Planctomycetota bacterium]|jgi:2-phosphosulfolactate phosphatase
MNPIRIEVALLPILAQNFSLTGGIAVVIDTLRFTTSATQAIASGARYVRTCTTLEQAFQLQQNAPERLLLCGERGGIRIKGFDLGNSPFEYTAAEVANRGLVFSTTNGTLAVETAFQRGASEIILGAMTNRHLVASHLCSNLTSPRASFQATLNSISAVENDSDRTRAAITILCAGTDGLVAGEDVLTAGAILDELLQLYPSRPHSPRNLLLSDAAQLALGTWQQLKNSQTTQPNLFSLIRDFYRRCRGGAKLEELSFGDDLVAAAAVDQVQCLAACRISSSKDAVQFEKVVL